MIIGTDVSHWNDDPNTPKTIDFDKMHLAGAEFCILKASQATWIDHIFLASYHLAKGVLPRGAYHYFDWTKSGYEQAKYFVSVIKDDPPEITPVVDYECREGVPARDVAILQLKDFVTHVEGYTGRIPMIYTGPYYWKEFGSNNPWWSRFPLWIANYYVVKPMVPAPWTNWVLWQYTPKGDGALYGAESLNIDLDRFYGTPEQFTQFCGGVVKPPLDMLAVLWNAHPELW
jgi:lysozyme